MGVGELIAHGEVSIGPSGVDGLQTGGNQMGLGPVVQYATVLVGRALGTNGAGGTERGDGSVPGCGADIEVCDIICQQRVRVV